jgi:hypothetical protein
MLVKSTGFTKVINDNQLNTIAVSANNKNGTLAINNQLTCSGLLAASAMLNKNRPLNAITKYNDTSHTN